MFLVIIWLIIICLYMKILKIKITSPEGIFTIMWLSMILGAVIFLSEKYKFEYLGVYWLLTAISSFLICSRFIKCTNFNKSNIYSVYKEDIERSMPTIPWNMNIIFIALSFSSFIYTMLNGGISFNIFSNLAELQKTSHMMAVNRYAGVQETTFIGQLLNAFNYVTPLCCGYSFNFAKDKKEKIICICSVIPLVLSMLLTNVKLGFISYIILFFVAYYVSYLYIYRRVIELKIKYVLLIALGFIVFLSLIYLSFYLRIGSTGYSLYKVITDKLYIYFFGHIQGFDTWFSNKRVQISDLGLGSNTFLAISSKLGLATKVQGIYGFETGSSTNIYSYFRGLIEDYGYTFSIIIVAIYSISVKYCYEMIEKGNKVNILCQWFLVLLMFVMYYVYISPFTYTSYYLAFIIFGFFLYWSFNIRLKFVLGKKKC